MPKLTPRQQYTLSLTRREWFKVERSSRWDETPPTQPPNNWTPDNTGGK